MIALIDDDTATRFYNEIDNASEEDRQQMADALLAWGEQKQKKEREELETHFSKLFTDDSYYQQINDNDPALSESLDPEATAKRASIHAYLEHQLNRPIDAANFEPERDAFAMQAFGQKNLNDGQLFDFIRGDYEWQKQRTEAINDLQMQAVGKAITDSQLGQTRPFVDGMTEVFNQWQQKYPELVDGKNDAAFLSQGYKLYYDTINDLDTVRPQASKALSTLTSFTQGNATDEDMQSLANDFVGAPPEDRQKIYKYVTLAAQAGQIDRAGIEQFAINLGQSFSRGFDFIPQGSLQLQEAGVNDVLQKVKSGQKVWVPENGDLTKATVSEQTPKAQVLAEAPTAGMFAPPQDGYREATPQEAEQFLSYANNAMQTFQVVRELRNVAKTGVDPIRPVMEKGFMGAVEGGAYGVAGSIGFLGATAINPFLGVAAYQANEYDRIRLENPDMDIRAAQGLALAEGTWQAALDRVQLATLSGKLPVLGRFLGNIENNGIRRTLKVGASVAEQFGQELAQDTGTIVIDNIAAALREDMPDKDFAAEMAKYGEQIPETLAASVMFGLVGGGFATAADLGVTEQQMKIVGINDKKIARIKQATSPEEADALIQSALESRTSKDIEAGKTYARQVFNEAQNPSPESPRISLVAGQDGTDEYLVTAPDGTEMLRTKSQQAAMEAVTQHGHAQLLNRQFDTKYEPEELRQIINDRIANWKSQDSNNTLVMESEGMNAQQKLEQLQAAGNAAQIQELHNRIANSPLKDTPYEQINILGEASVNDVAEMVFQPLIKINPNTRPENLREEIHHIGVKVALKNGSVTLDTLRGWLDATEKALPDIFPNLVRDTEGDIVESLAQVQAAYEDGKIDANEASALPASFIDYIKNMMRTFAEVLRRAVALRGAFKDGALPAEYESFLAESVGLNQQTMVDTTRERASGELTQGTFNYSVGQRVSTDTNPFPMEQKGKWWANEDFAQRGGRIVTMSPDEFLSQVRPLEVDEASRDNIDDLKNMMQSGRKLDPLAIYADGKEDGRHRAIAAKELGITSIPVLDFRQPVSTDTNYSIGIAPNGNTSNLKPEEQALAHSSEFKAWAGDWAALEYQNRIERFILDALDGKKDQEEIPLRKVTAQEVNEVMRQGGPNISGMEHVLDAAHIRHAFNSHSSKEEGDKKPGQRPLTRNDLMRIPEIINSYDSLRVKKAGTNRTSIIYGKSYQDGTINYIERVFETSRKNKPRLVTKTVWAVTEAGVKSNSSRVYTPDRTSNLPLENSRVNPESVTVKTDENGEPLASEIARFRKETGTSNYSIASQSEIDRVNRALGGMNRGPDERLKVYERAKQKFSKLMAWNSDELAAMADTGSDETQIRRNQLLQGFGELDAILQVLPPEVRGRVGGYTVLANIAPMDVFKDGVKVSEAKNMTGAIISAWMKEGQNIGQAGKQVSLPPGYTAKENLASKRADKALADFFRDRIKKIDTELEKVLVREYTEAIAKAVKQSRPKAGDNGVRKSTLGAETQKFADMVQRATLLDDEATPKRMAAIEAELANPDATAEDISALSEEWSILNTFGDLDNRSSETLAQGLDWLKGQLQMGREAWRIKEQARIDEQRARAAATIEWLGKGTAKKRNETKTTSQLASDLANHYLLSHANFEQFVTAIFPPEIAAKWSERLRKADEASQASEIRDRNGILNAVREGAKAANMSPADALLWLKADQKNAVAYLEGRMVKDERIAIDLAQKIVTGEADRSKLTDADIETLRNELAALPADTQKEYVTIKRVVFRGKDDKLTMSRGKAIQYLLSWNQPDVQIKMRKEGWTDESATDLKALVNDPVSRSVINYLQNLYGKGAGIVNPVYSRMFGMNMPQVKNYAPTRFLNAKDTPDINLDGSPTATGTTPSFAKSRVTHSAKIAPEDALTVAQGYIAQQAHWVHFAELAREFRAILSNPEVRESIKQTQGESVLKDAELWADQLEQRGGKKAREVAWINAIIGTAISGKAVSLLGFNLKTFAMNLDNTIRFALALDMKQVVSALSNPATITEDIQTVWESNAVQNRLQGGATAEARFLLSRYAGKPNFGAKIAEASMTPHNWLDSAATSISSAIVYRANLNDALAAGMPENLAKQAALDAASQAIYRFAQPVSFGQKSIVENSGGMLAKTFFLFMSDPRLKTAILADAARGLATGRGDKWTHIRRILVVETMAVLSHVVSNAFRDTFSDDDDEEIWNLGGFAKAMLLAPLQGFFFAGTVGELAISKLTGQKTFNSTTQNPLLSAMEQAVRAGSNLEDAFNLDDPDAMFKEWNNIFRSMALSPSMAAPAVLLNMVKPALGLYQNATTEE